ncbi:MAG: hypothetical protein P8R42_05675 [Candidatus Binatia bacterium]|nr:hypothetical protein [Candidatus Binatia bacterium]
MFSLAIFGASSVDGADLDPCEPVTALALFGGGEIDFSAGPVAPALDITAIAIFGGFTVKVHPRQVVRLSGISLFGGKTIEPRQLADADSRLGDRGDDEEDNVTDLFEEPLEIRVFTMFGGLAVKRWVLGQDDEA